jgi:enamine deaminase RidA (YjgF/YER057c/UK114 family)
MTQPRRHSSPRPAPGLGTWCARTCTWPTAADWEAIGRAHGEVFGEVRPAATMVVVAGLLDPRWKVEIEAEAVVG